MSKRPLRLDSPDWMPLDVLHPLICEKTGDRRLADRDLTDAMAKGRVRSMRRRTSPPEREQLLPSFWADDYQLDSSGPDIAAWSGELAPPELDRAMRLELVPLRGGMTLRGYVFYAWKPDCERIFGLGVAVEDTREPCRKARKIRASGDNQVAGTTRRNRAALLAKGTVYCTGKPYDTDHGTAGMAQKKVQKRT